MGGKTSVEDAEMGMVGWQGSAIRGRGKESVTGHLDNENDFKALDGEIERGSKGKQGNNV